MGIVSFLSLLLAVRVFLPQVDLAIVVCGVLAFYCVVTMMMASKNEKPLRLFYISLAVLAAYTAGSVLLGLFQRELFFAVFAVSMLIFRWETFNTWNSKMSTRRKLMISSWGPPREGNIYGQVSIDVTKTLDYIQQVREKTGAKVTITHIVIKAVGKILKKLPSVNGRLILGRYYEAETADVSCLVAIETDKGSDLGNSKITAADTKSLSDIAAQLQADADRLRKGKDKDFNKSKPLMSWLPTFLLNPVVELVGWLGALGLNIPALGVKAHPFGTAMITSVGMLGLDLCFVPQTPFARVPLIFMVGSIDKKPVVDENEKIVARPLLPITCTVDHRFMDGAQGAVIAKLIKQYVADPASMDEESPKSK